MPLLNYLFKTLSIIFIIFIAGCISTASGPSFKAIKNVSYDKALLYVYRLNDQSNRHPYSPTLYIDNNKVASIPQSGYLELEVPPGEHTFQLEYNVLSIHDTVQFNVKTQKKTVYYLRITDNYKAGISIMTKTAALNDLAKTRLTNINPDLKSN